MALLFGLLGERLDYSLSPKIHSMIMENFKLRLLPSIPGGEGPPEDALRGMKVLGVEGSMLPSPTR